ncbi:Maltose permease MAL31 [Daldinia childiae]|uniref:Maltose permease MAL31 n=1 Tax=Daldinia childiae TaxID=326645 RepID=UPI001447854A|nr:Maltose permease MAL31 [Daldinia childiae]KAF3065938.1 Maltose permease MAL31 [Daldinia childiae]
MSRDLVHLTRKPQLSPDSVGSGSDSTEYGQEATLESSGPASGELMVIPGVAGSSSSSGQTPKLKPKPKSTGSNRGHRKRTHAPEVWETHKAEIGRLYLDENKRLKDVMEIMENRWGFRASQKMYKTKLTQWKFFKNNRQADVANLLYLQRHRLAIGKESTFRRNGKLIDVEAYMRRRGVSAFDLVEVADSGDLPPTVRCRTPPSIPRLLDSPGDLCIKERFFQWTSQKFIKPRPIDTDYLKKLDAHHTSNALLSVQLLTHGCWLFSEGRNQEGGWFCRGAFALLHHILETSASLSFFEMMMAIQRYPNAEIMRELWSYLSRYAAAIDGVNQPLHRVLVSFARFSQQHSLEHNTNVLDWALQWASGIVHIVPGILFIGLFFIPESPRWLAAKGRFDEAERSLYRLRPEGWSVSQELTDMKTTLEAEARLQSGIGYMDLVRNPIDRRRTTVAILALTSQAASGAMFVISYGTYFFEMANVGNAFENSCILTGVGVAALGATAILITKFGRRRLMMISGFIFCGISQLIIAIVYTIHPNTESSGKALVGMSVLYIVAYNSMVAPYAWLSGGELSSQRLRSHTFGLATGVGFFFAWLTTFTAPYFINPDSLNWGPKYGYIWTGSCAAAGIWIFFFLPEAKDRTLEEIDEMFEAQVPARKFRKYRCTGKHAALGEKTQTEYIEERAGHDK